jgi:hypothetical protein
MSKEITVILLGLLIVITPYLGIPGSWKTVIFVLGGLCLAAVGFLLRGEALSRGATRHSGHFVENIAPQPAPRDHGIGPLN